MTLKEYINCSFQTGNIFKTICYISSVFYDHDEQSEQFDSYSKVSHAYTRVAQELMELHATSNLTGEEIVLSQVIDEGESFVDVHLRNIDTQETGAIEWVDWADLINLPVVDECGLQVHMIVAHVLHEITFLGFSRKMVIHEINKLKEVVDDIKQHPENLVSWEQFQQEIKDSGNTDSVD